MANLESVKKEKCENHEACLKMIQAVLDGSASETEINHFKENLESCLPCIENYELEKSIKSSLQDKLEKKCCPNSIVNQLKVKIGIASVLILGLGFDLIFISHLFCK